VAKCNLCGSEEFADYRGRPNEQCANCGSKARHRVGWEVYRTELFPLLSARTFPKVLHLAPEKALHDLLQAEIGAGYLPSDAAPDRYPHAKCMRLYFPDDFKIFPDGYFDAVLHNHVLEHIPGKYADHLLAFTRLLSPGGRMIFSIPGPYLDRETEEGGEHFDTDAERLEKFLQEDHFKIIGSDFPDVLASLPGGRVIPADIDPQMRESLSVRPKKAPFFIWEKDA